ncbi:SRPBCC domain-containing protein [Streptomyces lydicus]|uniref:SRPBCC domain-containing protein n=1 Tax=Streptomyces lydicus TaxID=47763 RepID=UPI00378BCC20
MLRLRRRDADEGQGNLADRTITWTLEPEGRGTRLFLVHEGFGPDDPYQVQAHRIMGGGRRSLVGDRLVKVLDEG